MKKDFFRLITSNDVRKYLLQFDILKAETLPTKKALNRVLVEEIYAPEDLPPFPRSTMDGYAVKARDLFGASETEPALLHLKGEIKMGQMPKGIILDSGEAIKIWTGGILPQGADAVVMLEYTQELLDGSLEIYRPVAPGENVIEKGEDCKKGQRIFKKGTLLRPQDLGLLAGLGITDVKVVKKPRVAIISTGDEIVSEDLKPPPGKIRDINSTSLYAMCEKSGALPFNLGLIGDSKKELLMACNKAVKSGADIVLVSGGSSVGNRDFTLEVFKELCGGEPLVHGVSIRPGKPTIISKKGNIAFFGLPGHVASCLVVYMLFVHFLIYRMRGLDPITSLNTVRVKCGEMIPSVIGREDFIRVSLSKKDNDIVAYPIYGKSGLISTLVKANGLLIVPRDVEGFYEGESAEVILL